jgi:hypothetical protein
MASTSTITAQTQTPITSHSFSSSAGIGRRLSYSSANGNYENGASQSTASASNKSPPPLNPLMSFTMSQGSQGGGLMLQSGSSFRQYAEPNGVQQNGSAPQIYSVSFEYVLCGQLLTVLRPFIPASTYTKWKSMAWQSCAVVMTVGLMRPRY